MTEIKESKSDPLTQVLTQAIQGSLQDSRLDTGAKKPNDAPVTYVTQSKYFSPVFNAAIFDGPIRIYFAQYQEAQALKLYFNLQERFGEVRKQARGIFKERGRNIFVMLYPTDEVFDISFGDEATERSDAPLIAQNRLGADYVVGVRGPMEDSTFETLCLSMEGIVKAPELRAVPSLVPKL